MATISCARCQNSASRPDGRPLAGQSIATTDGLDLRGAEHAWTQAELKAAQNASPVYLYELAWQTPVDGGRWHSPRWHSPRLLDLALVFDNVARSAAVVGTGPAWQPDSRATMVFDAIPRVVNGFASEDERTLLAGMTVKGPFDRQWVWVGDNSRAKSGGRT